MSSEEPLTRRLSSLPEPKPKVDQQANILKHRLVVAGKKVRERILRDMREVKSSMHFLPGKTSAETSGLEIPDGQKELEYYPQNNPKSLIKVDNFDGQNGSLTNLARKRPDRPPPLQKSKSKPEEYSEYFQYFTVKKKPSSVPASDPEDEKNISSNLVRETSSIRRKKKVKRRRSQRNLQETNDAEYYHPYEPEDFQKSSEDEFDYEVKPKVYKSPSDETTEDDSEDLAQIELQVDSDYSQMDRSDRLNDFHHCIDQYSDEYASVPIEHFPKYPPRRNLRETFSQIFQKTKSFQNLTKNISSLGIYTQPKDMKDNLIWFLKLNKKQYLTDTVTGFISWIFFSQGFETFFGILIFCIYLSTFLSTKIDETTYIFTNEPVYH